MKKVKKSNLLSRGLATVLTVALSLGGVIVTPVASQPVHAASAEIHQVNPDQTTLTVNWTKYSDVSDQKIDKMHIGIGRTLEDARAMTKAKKLAIDPNLTSYTFTGLQPSCQYYVNITVDYKKYGLNWDDYGYLCDPFYTTPDKAAAPYQTHNWRNLGSFSFEWEQKPDVSGYEYEVYEGNTMIKNQETGTGVFSGGGLSSAKNNKKYNVKVRAFTEINDEKYYGDWSDFTQLLVDSEITSSRKGYDVKIKKGKLSVKWMKTKGASGYLIYVSDKEKTGYSVYNVKGGKKHNATIKKFRGSKFNKNTGYYIAVMPYKKDDGRTYTGTIGGKVFLKGKVTRYVSSDELMQ